MDSCYIDVTVEFLAVAFHNILYYAAVYPKSVFETRRKYNIVVYRSVHPEVNDYIDLCLKSIAECLKGGQLITIDLAITNDKHEPVMKFVFNIDRRNSDDQISDAYLVQGEQDLRSFCLHLSNIHSKLKTPDNASFCIYLHTTESLAVALAINPYLENFPLHQVEEKCVEYNKILPLRRFTLRDHSFNTYIEFTDVQPEINQM